MSEKTLNQPSEYEINYIKALSRKGAVKAYANWLEVSEAEHLCLSLYIKSNDCILDLGCGTGRIAKVFGSEIRDYLGIDCSKEMIKAAKRLNPTFNFLCEDIMEPSYIKRDFDIVLLMNNVIDMLHPIERRKEVLNLVNEHLSNNGSVILSSHLLRQGTVAGYYSEDYHGAIVHTYRSTFNQLCKEIEEGGFEIKIAMRDYRSGVADWAYIVASKIEGR
jgi:2-polyprenyl-3-methyl-5-hydroxy-6-metoxy-1,4-benzoquinol methylase